MTCQVHVSAIFCGILIFVAWSYLGGSIRRCYLIRNIINVKKIDINFDTSHRIRENGTAVITFD